MPAFLNDSVWNDGHNNDDFEDEEGIEIVSLLDNNHDGDDYQTKIQTKTQIQNQTTPSGESSNYNKGARKTKHTNTNATPRVHHLVGVCGMVCAILLLATIILFRSSTLSDIEPPSVGVISNQDTYDGSSSSSSSKNINEKSQSLPPSLPSPSPPPSSTKISSETDDTNDANSSASASTDTENNNEKESQQLPSSANSNPNANPTSTTNTEDHDGNNNNNNNKDDTDWFKLDTGNSRIDRAYRLAMEELHQNIERNDADDASPFFVTGARGDRAWTDDTAYAIELGGGLVQPHVSRVSLESCTEEATISVGEKKLSATVWRQDTSDRFGGWPNLSDAIVGARGAWHLYLYTGNSTVLEWAYETTVASLLRAELDVLVNQDEASYFKGGLFGGGSSSLMASNSGYPKKYSNNGELVEKTKALSTNILYYSAYHYAYKMGTILMENNQIVNSLKDRSKLLKKTIREKLWMEKKGTYAYFEDEDGNLVEQTEGLGISLAMLSDDFESDHRIKMMFENVHRTKLGIPSLWPPLDLGTDDDDDDDDDDDEYFTTKNNDKDYKNDSGDDKRHHNGRIWPFVSAFFAIAAARHGNPHIFAEEMAHLIDLSEQQDNNNDNTFAEFYELDKSFERDRRRHLTSDAGYLGMVYKGLFGMDFQKGAIEFSPNKFEEKDGVLKTNETISLTNVKYRNSILDIYVTGFGTNVTSFKLNGEVREIPKMDAWVTGRQTIEIEVAPSIN